MRKKAYAHMQTNAGKIYITKAQGHHQQRKISAEEKEKKHFAHAQKKPIAREQMQVQVMPTWYLLRENDYCSLKKAYCVFCKQMRGQFMYSNTSVK